MRLYLSLSAILSLAALITGCSEHPKSAATEATSPPPVEESPAPPKEPSPADSPTVAQAPPPAETPSQAEPPAPTPQPKEPETKLLAGTGDFTTSPPVPGPSPFPPPEPEGEVVVSMNFDEPPTGQDPEFLSFSHGEYKAEARTLKDETTGETNQVGFLGGAEGEQHSWKPSMGWRFAPQTNGRLKITLDFYQASYDTGSLDFQIVDQHSSKFKEHKNRLVIYNNFVRLQWTPSTWFKDTITAGSEAKWHRISWEVPLPGGGDSEMAVTLDGERIGDIFHRYYPDGAVTTLRLYLFRNRSQDIAYYIDNVLIEKLPLNAEG